MHVSSPNCQDYHPPAMCLISGGKGMAIIKKKKKKKVNLELHAKVCFQVQINGSGYGSLLKYYSLE
jgi:hypothetical protein